MKYILIVVILSSVLYAFDNKEYIKLLSDSDMLSSRKAFDIVAYESKISNKCGSSPNSVGKNIVPVQESPYVIC